MILRDHKKSGYGLEPEKLPSSQKEAASLGFQYYISQTECRNGHKPAMRYTKGGACVDCVRARNAVVAGKDIKEANSRGLANMERAIASREFKPQYIPTKPCKNGHYLRWTASNNCVKCEEISNKNRGNRRKLSRIKKEYGLSEAQYYDLIAKSESKCQICGSSYDDTFALHIDHCHTTNIVRGLLCGKCNQGLGLFSDSIDILRKAIEYLNK